MCSYLFSAATYLFAGLVAVTWLPVMALLVVLTGPFDPNRRVAGGFLRFGSRLVSRSFPMWRIRMAGRWPDDGRPYVVVANHLSHADILLLSHMPREMKWIGGSVAFRLPVLGWLFRLAGDLPVRAGDPGVALRTLEQAGAYLRRGQSVMVFPEGKRSRGTLLPFKSGAFRLALQTGTPVLPVAVLGTDEALPREGWLLRPGELTARILEVVEVADLERSDHRLLRDRVHCRIANALRADGARTSGEEMTGQGAVDAPPY